MSNRGVYRPGTLALSLPNSRAPYSLDGTETNPNSTTSLKAKWSNDGKTRDLTIVMTNSSASGKGPAETIKERWTLAEGGEQLKVQRSVTVPDGTDVVNLVFRKGTSKP